MTTLQIFDVEHGSCALLTCDNGARMMIDCGHNATTGWRPGDHLRGLGARNLEMLVVTNYDQDHVSGFPNLADSANISSMLRNATVRPQDIWFLKSTENIISPEMARYVAHISNDYSSPGPPAQGPLFPGVTWHAYANSYPLFTEENDLSLVLHLVVHGNHFIFPGDLEKRGWKALVETAPALRAAVPLTDVLVAAHHGRESGRWPDLFDVYGCHPQIVVISDDYRQYDTQYTSTYYHSKSRGIPAFRTQGQRKVLTTRNDGTLTFYWGANGPVVA